MEKKIIYLTFFTSLLCLIFIGIVAYNSFTDKSFPIDADKLKQRITGPISEEDAADKVEDYRKSVTFYKKARQTWHRTDSVKYYIDSILIKYTMKIPPPTGYSWQFSFTPMFVKENEKARLTICFLPVLVDTLNPKGIYDFFDEREKNSPIYKYYYKPLYQSINTYNRETKALGEPGFIYDEGHLWP